MITCKTVTAMHTDASEDALGGWQRFRYRFHMGICPHCKAYAKGFAQTLAGLRELKESPPPSVKQRALATLRARKRP